jgi:hypothetical protein
MALAAGTGTLHHALKILLAQWQQTKEIWNDPIGKVFEEDYLVPLEKQLTLTLREIDRLAQHLASVRQECS